MENQLTLISGQGLCKTISPFLFGLGLKILAKAKTIINIGGNTLP